MRVLMMMVALLVVLLVVCGCNELERPPATDLSTSGDLSSAGDLAPVVDLEQLADLAPSLYCYADGFQPCRNGSKDCYCDGVEVGIVDPPMDGGPQPNDFSQ